MAGGFSIGDLAFRLVADSQGLFKQVEVEGAKAGDRAGKTMGSRIAKGIGLALTGGFALASKGALELDAATRQVAASAGIAESEMEGFRSQVVELFKSNPTKGFAEIAATIGTLKTDLGLTTEEAGKAAQAFLDFSKVTGQDGAAAVKALDDVLDAFNLDASESQRVMDLLVAGHVKYGGSVVENQKALATLAPQLKALGTDLEGGAALLNLFATTGLDASKATFALNTAVKNLKPGETLNDLIAQITAIEDPTLRAQAAIKIFGARGGVSLANALRPGITGLDDFKIGMGEAAGATEDAANKIDDSFQNKITTAFRTFIEGPLASVGPGVAVAVTAISGLVTALDTLGGAFVLTRIKAIASWLAILGPVAIAAGAGLIFLDQMNQLMRRLNDEQTAAALSAGDLSGRLEELNQQLRDGTITDMDYDIAVSHLNNQLRLQAANVKTVADGQGGLTQAYLAGERAAGRLATETAALSETIDEIGAATDENRQKLEDDFDAMLRKIIDSREPSRAAMAAYNQALTDPLDADVRLLEILAEIARVAPDLVSEAPNVRAAAILYTKQLEDEFVALRDDAFGFGSATAARYVSGFSLKLATERPRIGSELDEIRKLVETGSPPGPESPLHEIDRWGFDTGEMFGKRVADGIRSAIGAVKGALQLTAPEFAVPAMATLPGGSFSLPDPTRLASIAGAEHVAAVDGAAGLSTSLTVNVDLGSEFSRLFGTDRFIRTVDRELARLGS